MAANRKTRHDNTVTSRQYGRRAIYVPGDVRFQDGDAVHLRKLDKVFLRRLIELFFTLYDVFQNKLGQNMMQNNANETKLV